MAIRQQKKKLGIVELVEEPLPNDGEITSRCCPISNLVVERGERAAQKQSSSHDYSVRLVTMKTFSSEPSGTHGDRHRDRFTHNPKLLQRPTYPVTNWPVQTKFSLSNFGGNFLAADC